MSQSGVGGTGSAGSLPGSRSSSESSEAHIMDADPEPRTPTIRVPPDCLDNVLDNTNVLQSSDDYGNNYTGLIHNRLRRVPSAPPNQTRLDTLGTANPRDWSDLDTRPHRPLQKHQSDSSAYLNLEEKYHGHPWEMSDYRRKTCIVKLDGCKYTIGKGLYLHR